MADNGPLPGLDVIVSVAKVLRVPMDDVVAVANQMWHAQPEGIAQTAQQLRTEQRGITDRQQVLDNAAYEAAAQQTGMAGAAFQQRHENLMGWVADANRAMDAITAALDHTAGQVGQTQQRIAQLTASTSAWLRMNGAG